MADHDELLDYAEEDQQVAEEQRVGNGDNRGYVGIHSAPFKDFQLREELQNAIRTHGFEHPSEVQHQCIPQALNGRDIVCQAKSGMGKTAVFVLSILHMFKTNLNQCQALVLTHTRELSIQIYNEFKRFAKELSIVIDCYLGGEPLKPQINKMKSNTPDIVIGAPGRLLYLVEAKQLELNKVEFFVLDECDKMLQNNDMRTQVQGVFRRTPHNKQVMMFSATLPSEIRPICHKFTKNVGFK
jgi:ATP-dependent RNA helicase UAP56/SUB2